MRLLLIFSIILFVSIGINADRDYNSDDTVAIEALADGSRRHAREVPPGGDSCVTSEGQSGTCLPIQDCFQRLFPALEESPHATPEHGGGSFNQNLAQILVEKAGFCTGSEKICCANGSSDNTTFSVEPLSNKPGVYSSCGDIKVGSTNFQDPYQPVGLNGTKIVGGRKAALGEFPYIVAMLRRGQQFCGASLIDNRNILTAAHCVEFMNKADVQSLRLHIGDLDLYSSKDTTHVERRAKRVLYHKGFNMQKLDHDVALIHLDRPVDFSETIQPVCLHSGSPPYDTGNTDADVSGWGTTSAGGSQSNVLLAVRLRVITQEDCNQRYAKANKKVGPGMVCAHSPGKDSCQGDSGGPLVIEGRNKAKQIGIVSWGIGCASYPGVYTRVDRYLKWINKNKQ